MACMNREYAPAYQTIMAFFSKVFLNSAHFFLLFRFQFLLCYKLLNFFQNIFDFFRNVGVAEVIIHPNYQLLSNFDSDVALLRLNETVLPSDVVRPICLPSASDYGLVRHVFPGERLNTILSYLS